MTVDCICPETDQGKRVKLFFIVECDFVVDCQCVDWCVCQHLQELEQDLLQEETQLPVFFARETQELMSVYDDISKSVIANSAGSAAEGDDVHLFVRLSVCLSVAKMQKNAIFSKTKQFKAVVSVDDL